MKSKALLSTNLLLAIAVVLTVVVAVVAFLVVRSVDSDDAKTAAPSTSSAADDTSAAAESPSANEDTARPVGPVPGAPADAGGPIPAGATQISTIKKPRYGSPVAVFKVPSGNIGCGIESTGLQCRVSSYNQDKPYGLDRQGGAIDTITIKGGVADMSYHGSDVPPWAVGAYGADDRLTPQVVGYGQTVYYGQYVCHSAEVGLTCWDSTSGAGAFMARERTELFTATPASSTGANKCSSMTGEQAVAANVAKVPRFRGWAWDPRHANVENYDSCLALSWIVLPIEGPTASSPFQLMLFHNGEYIGTATERAHGFAPKVTRVDDSTIDVVWTWKRPGESTAGATGRSTARFHWDQAADKVVMTGEEPA